MGSGGEATAAGYLFSHIMHLYSSNVPLKSLLFKSRTQEAPLVEEWQRPMGGTGEGHRVWGCKYSYFIFGFFPRCFNSRCVCVVAEIKGCNLCTASLFAAEHN